MKRYQEYMDGVRASDTLDEKLRHLEKKTGGRPGRKYGLIAAAAVVLVICLGAGAVMQRNTEPAAPAGSPF